jgi:hypothetical protein
MDVIRILLNFKSPNKTSLLVEIINAGKQFDDIYIIRWILA